MAIEVITPIQVTEAQAKAIRKLALRNTGTSNNELASLLFSRAVKNTFTPVVKTIAVDAAKRWDMADAGGFTPPCPRDEYIKRATQEYKDILSDLEV